MRADAITVQEAHISGIRKLAAYAAQLVWIGGKFPIDIGANFTWYTALGYNTREAGISKPPSIPSLGNKSSHISPKVSQNNLRFEHCNILFNLAALYSQLAVAVNRSTSDGLKSACNYFCLAAGVISHLKNVITPDLRSLPPEDMDTMTLESLEQLLLAQAQECFWAKAVTDGYKDASIAKLAAKVCDFYDQAGTFGINSNSISSEWIHYMNAKHHHFAAAAQYRAACDCLEKRKYGEEVARLRDSVVCVNNALRESRYINKVVLAELQALKTRVQEDLKRAEKDNDLIYLIPVPPKSELKPLDRASMASAKVPKEVLESNSMIGDNGPFGQPLFAKLVPFAVHVAASIYSERRDRLVNNSIIEELEILTNNIHEVLESLSLPGSLQALEKPLGLPPTLLSHAEEIRQQDGLNRLYRSMEDISKLKVNDQRIYSDAIDILNAEAAEDEKARGKHGTDRWRRLTSREAATKLYTQAEELQGYLKSAEGSDQLVKTKLSENEKILKLLLGTDRGLEEFIPSTRNATMTAAVQGEVRRLRTLLNEVGRLESRRRRKIETLKEKVKADNINTVILAEAARLEREYPTQKLEPAHFEDFFEKRLQQYDNDKDEIAEESRDQGQLVHRLKEANLAFSNARKGDSSTKDREKALQKLEHAYFKYKEVIANLDVGRKFYSDLAKILGRFKHECENFSYQRQLEAVQIDTEISNSMASLNISQTTTLHKQREAENERRPYATLPPAQDPLTAPVATRASYALPPTAAGMWSPEMGIKFGSIPSSNPRSMHPNEGPIPATNAAWEPSRGLKFG
ncbi:MAG: pH-response regulator protein palA/rim20 [Trizodia sp. TS-e1964]|nr:MAG: pH-response regulator protein palA/rim20 [Trizodia sp. TS-e1964]